MNQQPEDDNRETQLAHVVRDTLEKNGELNILKAAMRAKVLEVVRGGETSAIARPTEKVKDTPVHVLNQLIMEYFYWFGYQYSVEMFSTETGIESQCPNRQLLESHFGVHTKELPVLLNVIISYLDSKDKQ